MLSDIDKDRPKTRGNTFKKRAALEPLNTHVIEEGGDVKKPEGDPKVPKLMTDKVAGNEESSDENHDLENGRTSRNDRYEGLEIEEMINEFQNFDEDLKLKFQLNLEANL